MAAGISFLFADHLVSLFTLFLLLCSPNSVTGIPDQEFDAMISALRFRGYNLFANAIMTSDLRYRILDGRSFTIFVPSDSLLFALDMTVTAHDYVQTLRYHVSPHRYTIAGLNALPSGSFLRTLLRGHELYVQRPSRERLPFLGYNFPTVDGVDIIFPELYLSHSFVVHGLDGILRVRPQFRRNVSPPAAAPQNLSGKESLPPTEGKHRERTIPSPKFQPPLAGTSPTPYPESRGPASPTESPLPNPPLSTPMESPSSIWPPVKSPLQYSPDSSNLGSGVSGNAWTPESPSPNRPLVGSALQHSLDSFNVDSGEPSQSPHMTMPVAAGEFSSFSLSHGPEVVLRQPEVTSSGGVMPFLEKVLPPSVLSTQRDTTSFLNPVSTVKVREPKKECWSHGSCQRDGAAPPQQCSSGSF